MSFFPTGEKIIETKKCRISGKEFSVTDKDVEILDKISPVFDGKKYSFPSPTLCPDERQRRRLSFRNERKMYKSKCSKTGKEMISLYSPDKDYTVYEPKTWWGDDWSATDYGCDVDFGRTFFGQFSELYEKVPKLSLLSIDCENCDFTNFTLESKNCYLCVGAPKCENSLYCNFIRESKNVVDSTFTYESELIYYGMDVTRCYHCFFIKNCVNCQDCFGLEECENCHHCIGCYGLKNKEYHVFNKPVSREYFDQVWTKALEEGGSLKILADLKSLREKQYVRNTHSINCENCFGDQIENGKNGYMCFDAKNIEDARYVYFSPKNINAIDCTYTAPFGVEYAGEVNSCLATQCFGCFHIWHGSRMYYSISCHNSEDVFGSTGIKKGKNMVLNKAYARQEYETLCGKIIDHMRSTGEWGEFFPHELSPFGYNETVAQEYFPMTKEGALNMPRFEEWLFGETPFLKGDVRTSGQGDLLGTNPNKSSPLRDAQGTSFKKEVTGRGWLASRSSKSEGWNWYDGESKNTYIGNHYSPLPINQYDERKVGYDVAQKNIDELLHGILLCETSEKPFKVIKQELAFYIENSLPIPTKHPDERHRERMSLRNPRTLYERMCPECQQIMVTTYHPDRREKVVCEKCYRKLVY